MESFNRFASIELRNGLRIKNRVVVPPMASGTADKAGFVTPKTLEHYGRLLEADPGLLIVEYTFVHTSGRSEPHQLSVAEDAHIRGLRALSERIRRSGTLAGLQIVHSGGKSSLELTGGRLMGPSGIRVPVKGDTLEKPDEMTIADIRMWMDSFAMAIDRAVEAGFDLVELHAAHGYGLNQWLSPITNQRIDEYRNGPRLLLEIIESARRRHPRLLLSVRMPGQDFIEGGLTPKDSIEIAKALESAGVDLLHISSGIGGWRRPSSRIGEGYLVCEAARIQAQIATPVIGVGGIESGTYIDEGLRCGWFQLAAVGRAILKDPAAWRKQNLEFI